jgi:phosphohistidine phosphatase
MARQLWLLRHAEAEPHGTRPDAQRRLTARGGEQARIAGQAIRRLQTPFDLILFSPRVRARQTAELASQAWSEQQRALMAVHRPLSSGFDAAQALEAMAAGPANARVLVVGHEPDLSTIVAELTGARADIKKGGLAIVRLQGGAELVALMRPRELALIAAGRVSRNGSSLRAA